MDIKGKSAVVTGASSDDGIGAECAKLLAARGCNVVVNYATNKAGAGRSIMAACKANGVEAVAVQGELSPRTPIAWAWSRPAVDRWGRLDVLINNAATTKPIPHKRMDLLDAAEFQRVFSASTSSATTECAAPRRRISRRPATPRS